MIGTSDILGTCKIKLNDLFKINFEDFDVTLLKEICVESSTYLVHSLHKHNIIPTPLLFTTHIPNSCMLNNISNPNLNNFCMETILVN